MLWSGDVGRLVFVGDDGFVQGFGVEIGLEHLGAAWCKHRTGAEFGYEGNGGGFCKLGKYLGIFFPETQDAGIVSVLILGIENHVLPADA